MIRFAEKVRFVHDRTMKGGPNICSHRRDLGRAKRAKGRADHCRLVRRTYAARARRDALVTLRLQRVADRDPIADARCRDGAAQRSSRRSARTAGNAGGRQRIDIKHAGVVRRSIRCADSAGVDGIAADHDLPHRDAVVGAVARMGVGALGAVGMAQLCVREPVAPGATARQTWRRASGGSTYDLSTQFGSANDTIGDRLAPFNSRRIDPEMTFGCEYQFA